MLVRRLLTIVGAGLVVLVLPWGTVAAIEANLLSESADGTRLIIEIKIPAPRATFEEIDGAAFIRFEVPGYRPEGESGTPELCVGTQLIGIPAGGTARLRILQSDIEDRGIVRVLPFPYLLASYPEGGSPDAPETAMGLEELRYDPRIYAAGGATQPIAKLGPVGRLRHQSVVPLEVRPLLFDVTSGRLRVVRSVRVEIIMSAGASGLSGDPVGALSDNASWRRIQGASVLNAQTAQKWLRAPKRQAQLGTPLKSGLLRPGLLAEDEWKLRVRWTGSTRVPAAALISQGFPEGTPVAKLRLVLKRFDSLLPLDPTILEIPLHLEDVDQDGLFSTGDAFVFWAEQPRDDSTAGERAQRYSFDNVYWLSVVESGSPARMPVRLPLAGAVAGPSTFAQTIIYEEDLAIDNWVYADSSDLYYLLDRARIGSEARFVTPVPGRNVNSPLDVCVETQQDWLQRAFRVDIEMQSGTRVLLGSHPGFSPPRFVPAPRAVICNTIPSTSVEPGDIIMAISANPQTHGFLATTPFVDNVQVKYTADYVATNDAIRFNNGGATGTVAFTISGFSGAKLVGLDVSDPKSPAWFDLSTSLSGDTLTFTDAIPAASVGNYDVRPDTALEVMTAAQIEKDVTDPILADLANMPMGSFDVLVVAWDGFASEPAMQDWMAFRQSQGYRVRLISTSNTYDAFNGGLLHYDAIFRLVELAYRNWGIAAVMLVGDGSEDAAGLRPGSGPNYVPSRVKYFPVVASGGNGGQEYRNDMNQRHYVKMDGEADFYPDLLIGRLPVSNSEELRNIVDKTLLYEQPAAGDDHAWRKRVLMLSDDEWVKRIIDGGIKHRRGSAERNFFRSIDACCDIVNNAFPGDLQCVEFFLHTHSDSLSVKPFNIPEHEPWDWEANPNPRASTPGFTNAHPVSLPETNYYIDKVTRALADSVGEGCLFLALQTHANRSIVADESIMRRSGESFEPEFYNNGKPFVFFGLGCHLNEYAIIDEEKGFFGSDALGELLVTVAQRGAVASYASTGFEFLTANFRYHKDQLWPAIFEKRWSFGFGREPVDADTLTSTWLLTELIAVAEITNGDIAAINRYCFLGDPLLQLDAGTPRFQVTVDPATGSLVNGTQLVAKMPGGAIEMEVIVSDEQGIDSLWVELHMAGGHVAPVDSVVITANLDTAPQIIAKRSWKVTMSIPVDNCDFDVVVGARDVAGRISEFRASVKFTSVLFANEVPLADGDIVDARTAFRQEIRGCEPLTEPLDIVVRIDGDEVAGVISNKVDGTGANWDIAFNVNLAPGDHTVSIFLEGQRIEERRVSVEGALGLFNVLAYPNPFADWTRIYFEMSSSIAGGNLRIMDLNGRLVQVFNLADPGVLQTENATPAGSVGTSIGWNFVVWDGTDRVGDRVGNGVYLYELRIEGINGEALRTRDKVVLMY